MSETVNQETNATNEQTAEVKTFTQEELNSIVADRLERERKKFDGFEDYKAKAARLDELEAASKTELQKATEKAEKLEEELSTLKNAEKVRGVRSEVAKETGVPAELLTGETKEELENSPRRTDTELLRNSITYALDTEVCVHKDKCWLTSDYKTIKNRNSVKAALVS